MNWGTNGLRVINRDGRRTVFRLSSGAVIAIDHPENVEIGEPIAIIRSVLGALDALEQATAAAAADETLSDVGRSRKLEPLRSALSAAASKAQSDLEQMRARIATMTAEVFRPPAIDKADVVTALGDVEIRNYIRSLSGSDRAAFLEQLSNEPRLAAAVLRSPVQIPAFTPVAEAAWVQHAGTIDPAANLVMRHQQSAKWAHASMEQISAATTPLLVSRAA